MKIILLTVVGLFALVGANQLQRSKSDDFAMVVANEFCDRTIELLKKKFVILDPLFLPHLEGNSTFNWLFEEHVMTIDLDHGVVLGLTTLNREGDCVVNYELRMLRIRIPVKVSLITAQFDFGISVLLFNPDGTLDAKITDEIVQIDLLVDMKETRLYLQGFSMTNTGKLNLHASGLGLLGTPLTNIVLDVFTAFFKNTVMVKISETVEGLVNQMFDNIGEILPEIPEDNQSLRALKFHFDHHITD